MLSRRMLINFLLLVLIIIFTYIGNKYDVQTGYQEQQPVSQLQTQQVQNIEMQTADWSLALRRQADGWTIETPIRWPANNVHVERLLDVVNSQTDSRLDAGEADLDQFGLKFPRAIMQLDQTQILFGATNNIGERRYVMIGSTVYLLPDIHLPFISQGLISVVDRRLLPRSFEMNRLSLPDFELKPAQDGIWRAAAQTDIEQSRIDRLIENWRALEASRVKPYDKKLMPRQKIQVQLANGESIEFFVMSIDPEIVIANPAIGLQYHYPADRYYELISLRADENPA